MYVFALAAAYPVLMAVMWPGSLPMARRPSWFSLCGVSAWVYLCGVVLPLCWGAAVDTGG